ncbi:hypothetical protein F9C11_32580 [Amycolatopsis sp. VS8301801F10]|uniref:hypothetical protein n=1 Tax=Amycolatopsis sp. VS8301801F10 TaxID=2652442 RepID=UPI0038FBF3F3
MRTCDAQSTADGDAPNRPCELGGEIAETHEAASERGRGHRGAGRIRGGQQRAGPPPDAGRRRRFPFVGKGFVEGIRVAEQQRLGQQRVEMSRPRALGGQVDRRFDQRALVVP